MIDPAIEHVYARFDTLRTSLDDYIWPTDASHIVTSTFGEFRRTHFHAGIDISTNNTVGYRVFASRDGYVWRISISPTGYGKMLLVRHPDGFSTAYAHLKTFNDTINSVVLQEQRRLERFPVEIELDSSTLPVMKGELLAFTGNTGTGTAHMHFEIRDENLNPVNPQLFTNIATPDTLTPYLKSLAVIPLDERSSVAGRAQPWVTRKFNRKRNQYTLPYAIRASGRIGFGISARDRVSGTYHPVGIHRVEVYYDDSLTFTSQLDRIPADDSKQILLFYSLRLMKRGTGRFQQLFVDDNTALPLFERRSAGAGIIDTRTSVGDHAVRIVCKDIYGNAVDLAVKLVLSHPPERGHYLLASNIIRTEAAGSEDIFHIPSRESGWFSFDNDSLQVWYDSGAVFKPLNVRIVKEYTRGRSIYRLFPHDVLLNDGIDVFVRSSGDMQTSPLIYFRDNRDWEMRPTSRNSATGYFSIRLTHTLGDIALFLDTIPPQIARLRIQTRGRRPSIHFRTYDARSGVDAKEIKSYIDGEFVVPEIDDRWRVRCELERPLAKGRHEVAIAVGDNAGNLSIVRRTFYVQ